jgi:arylsulfatase A-like enzyme
MGIRTNPTPEVTESRSALPAANPEESATEQRPGPLTIILMAACFGLATGLLELVVKVCQWSYDPKMRLGTRLVNRHYLWMIPCAHLVIFAVCGLGLGLVAKFWPKAAVRLAAYLLCGLASLALLLIQAGLHKLTYILLACGFASLVAPLIVARTRHLRLYVRRVLPGLAGAVAALACFAYGRELLWEHRALTRLAAATPGAPNVLLIVLDTVRADGLSLYGYDRDTSPNLVRLGRRGVQFDRAGATSSWTLPSHASIFTGRWPNQLAVGWFRPLDATYPTLAEALGARGYVTGGFVANSVFCHADYGLARGFLHYEDIPVSPVEVLRSTQLGKRLLNSIDRERYRLSALLGDELFVRVFGDDPRASLTGDRKKDAARINRDALNWISAQRGRPFFVFLNYCDTHDPYIPPLGVQRHFGRQASTQAEHATIRDWLKLDRSPRASSNIELVRDAFDDCTAYLDDQLGRLFNELETRGLLENTLVLITADHGELFGEHNNIFGHWSTLYSEEIRVPLLVISPGRVPSGKIISAPVSLRDLPATVVDLAGLGPESSFPGRSLARFWDPGAGANLSAADPVFSEVELDRLPMDHKDKLQRSLTIGDKVYICNARGDEELYNVADDPAEAHNLAGLADARPALEQFRTSLKRLLADNPDPRDVGTIRRQGPGSIAGTSKRAGIR